MAIVAILNLGSSREAEAMHLRRCLAFLEANWGIQLREEHVRGVDNEVEDAMSRNRIDTVVHLRQQMMPSPEDVDRGVLQVVVGERQAGKDPD